MSVVHVMGEYGLGGRVSVGVCVCDRGMEEFKWGGVSVGVHEGVCWVGV